MDNISQTEENYLKAIYKIAEQGEGIRASTNAIAGAMNTSAASVTDMVKRLSTKGLIHYESHRGVVLTPAGALIATSLVRRHRLWEVFLVDKLGFSWDEVHEIAEELEHIKSELLIARLDDFLGFPKFDPHGDPIPDAQGQFTFRQQHLLAELRPNAQGRVVGVQDHSPAFLQYLDRQNLGLGSLIRVLECYEYDESVKVEVNQQQTLVLSQKVAQNLFIQE